jgi:hypothetical protein
MNSLDRIIKRERKRRYKKLKKLFKARDMASKYIDRVITISLLDGSISRDAVECNFTGVLAKMIIDTHRKIVGIRPPAPPSQNIIQ